MYDFSSSTIDAFATCAQRGHYAYREGGYGIKPDHKSRDLSLGSIWHAGLEAHYSGKDAYLAMLAEADAQMAEMEQVWDEDREAFAEQVALAEAMYRNYLAWDASQEPLGDIVAVEDEFAAKIYKPGGKRAVALFRGKVDLAVMRPDGAYLVDHKTLTAFGDTWEAENHLSRQFRRYAWAWQQVHGARVEGFIVNGARKALPRVPPVLASGKGLSKAKIDTTRETYLKAITDNGFDPADYADILETLPSLDAYFRRDVIYFSQQEIAEAGEELYELYRMVRFAKPIKTPTPLCSKLWPCPYRTLCVEDTPEARMLYRAKERRLEELSA